MGNHEKTVKNKIELKSIKPLQNQKAYSRMN